MKLRILILFFSFLSFGLYAQFDENTKLRALYEKALYTECIEKSIELLERDKEDLYPYFWQLKSYLAIHFSKFHEKQKTALDKALNLAVKIHKKDKNSFFKNTYPEVFEQLEIECLKAAESNCVEQFEKSDKIYQKLIEIDYKPSVLFARFMCWEFNSQPESILLLEKLVDRNYNGIKEGLKSSIENEKYHVELLNRYFFQGLTTKTKLLLKKTKEVYPNSQLTYAALLQGCENLFYQYSFDSDIADLFNFRKDLKSIDSIYPTFAKEDLHKRVDFLIANKYLNLSENDQSIDAYKAIKEYLNAFQADLRLDSCKRFFLTYLQRNKSRQNLNYKKVFTYWTDLSKFYQKLSYIEAVKQNENYLQKENELHLGMLYINYCITAFPQDKLALTQIKKNLDILLIASIKKGESKKDFNEIIELSDNKQVKNVLLDEDLRVMAAMLARKQFSSLSRLINKDLLLFPQNPKLLAMKKQLVISDFKNQIERYKNIDENLYFSNMPDASKCVPGVLNNMGNLSVITQINYVRRLVGIYDSCVINPAYAAACQQAALMMEANDALDHHPPRSWKCYKHEAATEAGNSNLSLGYGFNWALMGQMTDNGARNGACGHRRWILNPYNAVFGLGSTLDAMCLKVFATEDGYASETNKRYNFNDSQYIAWPSADYFPLDIAPNRWSFSLDGADFKGVNISVTCNGVPLHVSMEKQEQGYALNTVVWTLDKLPVKDLVYVVKVSNVINYHNEKKSFSYKVIFLDIK
jgi:hypothetical protein